MREADGISWGSRSNRMPGRDSAVTLSNVKSAGERVPVKFSIPSRPLPSSDKELVPDHRRATPRGRLDKVDVLTSA
jgi:hypothetical protein